MLGSNIILLLKIDVKSFPEFWETNNRIISSLSESKVKNCYTIRLLVLCEKREEN